MGSPSGGSGRSRGCRHTIEWDGPSVWRSINRGGPAVDVPSTRRRRSHYTPEAFQSERKARVPLSRSGKLRRAGSNPPAEQSGLYPFPWPSTPDQLLCLFSFLDGISEGEKISVTFRRMSLSRTLQQTHHLPRAALLLSNVRLGKMATNTVTHTAMNAAIRTPQPQKHGSSLLPGHMIAVLLEQEA